MLVNNNLRSGHCFLKQASTFERYQEDCSQPVGRYKDSFAVNGTLVKWIESFELGDSLDSGRKNWDEERKFDYEHTAIREAVVPVVGRCPEPKCGAVRLGADELLCQLQGRERYEQQDQYDVFIGQE